MRVLVLAALCSFTLFQASGAQEAPSRRGFRLGFGLGGESGGWMRDVEEDAWAYR